MIFNRHFPEVAAFFLHLLIACTDRLKCRGCKADFVSVRFQASPLAARTFYEIVRSFRRVRVARDTKLRVQEFSYNSNVDVLFPKRQRVYLFYRDHSKDTS